LVLLAAPFAGASPALADDSAVVGYDVRAACPTPGPGEVQCYALVDTPVAADGSVVQPASSTPSGFGPADLRSAYNLPGGAAGQGLTVAVVDAYDLPSVESDLAAYRSYYKLPACTTANGCFQKVNQSGVQGSYPTADSGWGGEIALDLDMVSAICPNCKILLVEANDAGLNNLAESVNTAVSLGAIAVSRGEPATIERMSLARKVRCVIECRPSTMRTAASSPVQSESSTTSGRSRSSRNRSSADNGF